jgi:hypothetical protein
VKSLSVEFCRDRDSNSSQQGDWTHAYRNQNGVSDSPISPDLMIWWKSLAIGTVKDNGSGNSGAIFDERHITEIQRGGGGGSRDRRRERGKKRNRGKYCRKIGERECNGDGDRGLPKVS